MSKPRIYANCKAGCLWETVHKDDFERSASIVAVQKVDGEFLLESLKTYRIRKSTGLVDSNYGFRITLHYRVDGEDFEAVLYDPVDFPIKDSLGQFYNFDASYKEFMNFRLCHLFYYDGGGYIAVLDYDGKIFYHLVRSTTRDPIIFQNVHVTVSGADECYLVNEHAEILVSGKSAYAYAQDGGFAGTEAEFAETLARVAAVTVYAGKVEVN